MNKEDFMPINIVIEEAQKHLITLQESCGHFEQRRA